MTPECLKPAVEYGCVLCQSWHDSEADPDLFRRHLHRQAKHHYRERPPTPNEVLRRLATPEENDRG